MVWEDYRKRGLDTNPATNLPSIICPAGKMCWGNGGIELVGGANQCLIKLEALSHEREPMPNTAWMTRTGEWITQRPRVESKNWSKKNQ